ncbi:zf-HC2 domain-containing protein [uncultured Porticoccus sp.]|uniref:anti-sigma factor family protein n=1 Tax=uncultured Porticoccus sp. TaxID=1256050 RepID=UPI0030DD49F7
MLKCRDVVNTADQLLDGDMNHRQLLAIKMHLLMCSHCRRYVRQLRALLRAIPFMYKKASDTEVSKVMEHVHSHRDNYP